MFERPWKFFTQAEPDKEYFAFATRGLGLSYKWFWKIPTFFRYTNDIQKQLSESDGLIGYSLAFQPFPNNA